MKEVTQRKIFQFFLKNNVENFIGVPDSTLKYFIDEGIKKKTKGQPRKHKGQQGKQRKCKGNTKENRGSVKVI